MNRTIARLSALLVTGACAGAACGGKVVLDGIADSSTGGAGAGGGVSTGGGGCDAASHTIDITDFDVSCTVASDCIRVVAGDLCIDCGCPFSAINAADMMKYEAELQVKKAGIPLGGCGCPAADPICVQGQCATKMP